MKFPGEDTRHTETLIKVAWRVVLFRLVLTFVAATAVVCAVVMFGGR